jgi:hypothetical protein
VLAEFVGGVTAASALRRARYVLSAPVYRQRRLDDLILRLMIAAGRV